MTEITIRPARHDADGNRLPPYEPKPSTLADTSPKARYFTPGRLALLGAAAATLVEGAHIGFQTLAHGKSVEESSVMFGAGAGLGLFGLLYPPSAPGTYGGTPMDRLTP